MAEMQISKKNVVDSIIPTKRVPERSQATCSAPVNIALVKYWGKRDEELRLPVTDSLSVALSLKTSTTVMQADHMDEIFLNGQSVSPTSSFYVRAVQFLQLFRPDPGFFFRVKTVNEVPTAAGLASSASGFAALVRALDLYFGWQLGSQKLSILARLGSGSASRSICPGFVQWHKGCLRNGEDSYAEGLGISWESLRFGVLLLTSHAKKIGSGEAMRRTVETSPIYSLWPSQVAKDLDVLRQSIVSKDFITFGETIEKNALLMHSSMHTAWPPICYWNEQTIAAMNAVWDARSQGIPVFFTMDAGPNVKIFYPENQEGSVSELFPSLWQIPLMWK